MFGAAKPAAPTTSLFGNITGATLGGTGAPTTGGFGGFGINAGQTGTTGGIFGQKPATGGLGGGLFGVGGAGLGATTINTFGGGFGQQQQQQQGVFNLPAQGGLTTFGTNPLQPHQQPLIATVDKNPYGNNPLFDLSNASNSTAKLGPSAVALDGSSTGRKSASPHYPISPRVVSKIKLRGFSFPTHNGKSAAISNRKHVTSGAYDGIEDDAVLGTGAFAPRVGNKRLVFDNNVDTANIVALVNDKKKTDKRRVMFDPNLELIAANKNATAAVNEASPSTGSSSISANAPTTTTSLPELTAGVITSTTTTTTTTATATTTVNAASASSIAIKNGYYISPTLETLSGMSKENLKHVQNLIVGRKGYGQVKFEGAVDLSNIILDDIMGNIVVIEDKKVVVYPREDTKKPKGTELNVPALVTIENCFSHDKNTGAAIRDPVHPRFKLFKDKLRKREHVEFISYEDETGAWTFKVAEF